MQRMDTLGKQPNDRSMSMADQNRSVAADEGQVMGTSQRLMDQAAIADVILRERLARDNACWPEMESYYHPESTVDVSWFQGSGAEFVAQSKWQADKRIASSSAINFHVMSPAVVTVKSNRAIAETPCSLRSFMDLGGVAVSRDSFVRLLWRARPLDGRWLIAGLRCIYVRDLLYSCQPGQVPALDEARLKSYRLSYRYTAYMLTELGLSPRDDLPGDDRPETVAALRAGEQQWLDKATN